MLSYSEQESKTLGIQIARASWDGTNVNTLLDTIIDQQCDVVKLSCPSDISNIYEQLNELQMPYYILGMVSSYRILFPKMDQKTYRLKDIEFIEYDGSQKDILQNVSRKSFQEIPGSFYNNPEINHIVDHEKQVQCFVDYICQYNNQLDSEKWLFLVKVRGQYAGFITLKAHGDKDCIGGHAGVIPERRYAGIYLDMIRFIHNFPKSIGRRFGYAYAQLQNHQVHKTLVRENMQLHDSSVNIHINSLFNHSVTPPTRFQLATSPAKASSDIQTIIQDLVNPDFYLATQKTKWLEQRPKTTTSVTILTPIKNEEQELYVVKLHAETDQLLAYSYLWYQKN